MAARIPMIKITTRSSMSVKPLSSSMRSLSRRSMGPPWVLGLPGVSARSARGLISGCAAWTPPKSDGAGPKARPEGSVVSGDYDYQLPLDGQPPLPLSAQVRVTWPVAGSFFRMNTRPFFDVDVMSQPFAVFGAMLTVGFDAAPIGRPVLPSSAAVSQLL